VLKVPHHGSRYQDLPFLQSLHARLALISVGADNDYGHPAPETVSGLAATGEQVLRTDRDGSVAVVLRDGRLSAVTSR
jgi:competence protein ComEC